MEETTMMRRNNMVRRLVVGTLVAAMSLSIMPTTAQAKVSKQESVYVMANPDGSTKSITVSDQLQGAGEAGGSIKDVSKLSDIKNVKGDETFDQSGQNLTWNTNGADIYYQGKTEEQLPVSVKFKFELDGKEVKPEDIVGQSGKMKITISYENNSKKNVTIAGKSETVNTPFLMATGMIFDSEKFTDLVLDDGGKIIDDGSKSIVIVLGMPGLKESLNLTGKIKEKLDDKLKNEFTLTCNVKDFEMKNTFTFASANLLNMITDNEDGKIDIDLSKIDDKVDDLDDAIDKLDDGSKKLSDGVKELDKGVDTLASSIKKYASEGVKKLTAGIRELGANAPKLKKGVGKYIDGADKLAKGTKDYVKGSGQLTSGIKTLTSAIGSLDLTKITSIVSGIEKFAEGIAAAADKDKMEQLTKGATAVSDGIGTVNKGLSDLESSFSNNETAIKGLETALAANEKVLEGLKTAKAAGTPNLDQAIATLEQTTAGEKQAIEGLKTVTDAQKSGIGKLEKATASSSDLASGAKTIATTISTLVTGISTMADPTTIATIQTAISSLSQKLPALVMGVKMLGEGADKLSANDKKLTKGCTDLISGGKTMRSSVDKLGNGMKQLSDGAGKLDSSTDQVVDGVGKLKDGTGKLFGGAKKLSDGFSEFRKKAIDKLLDFYNNDIKNLVDRVQGIMDAGREYKSFSGIDNGMDGEVKFIIETEAVKADD